MKRNQREETWSFLDFIKGIPNELCQFILCYLMTDKELLCIASVCKEWKLLIYSIVRRITLTWKESMTYIKQFPNITIMNTCNEAEQSLEDIEFMSERIRSLIYKRPFCIDLLGNFNTLPKLKMLTCLSVENVPITNMVLKQLTNLTALSIKNETHIRNAKFLSHMKNLNFLSLSHIHHAYEFIPSDGDNDEYIYCHKLGEEFNKQLSCCTQLKHLKIDTMPCNLNFIYYLTNLESLYINNLMSISSTIGYYKELKNGFSNLSKCYQLHSLHFSDEISNPPYTKGLTNLTCLTLKLHSPGKHAVYINQLPNIKHLNLLNSIILHATELWQSLIDKKIYRPYDFEKCDKSCHEIWHNTMLPNTQLYNQINQIDCTQERRYQHPLL